MAVSTEFMEPTSSGTEQITETSEVQKDNKNVKVKVECDLLGIHHLQPFEMV